MRVHLFVCLFNVVHMFFVHVMFFKGTCCATGKTKAQTQLL